MHPARRVLNNAFFLVLARLARLLASFLLTPYVVRQLGLEEYGLFAVLGSTIQYFALVDFGLRSSFVRYISTYAASGRRDEVRRVVTFGTLFYLALGLLLLPVAAVIAPFVIGLLNLSGSLKGTAQDIFLLTFEGLFLTQSLGVVTQLLNGLQKMHITSMVGIVSQIVYVIAVIVFLQLGFSIYGIMYAVYAQLVFSFIVQLALAFRTFGQVFCNPFRGRWSVIRELFRFGGWMQVNSLAGMINTETDRIVIGSFVSVATVTYYEIGNKLALMARVWPLLVLEALLPTASALSVEDEHKLDRAYVQGSRTVALVTFGLGAYIVGAGDALTRVWMGPGYEQATGLIALLVVTYAINNLTGAGTTMVRALGVPRYEAYYSTFGAILNIAVTVALAPTFGLYGVLVGTAVGSSVGSVYFLWLFHRLRRLSLWTALGEWLWRLLLAATLAGGCLWLVVGALPRHLFEQRLEGLLVLGLLGVGYLFGFTVLLRVTRFLQPADLHLVRRVAPGPLVPILDSPTMQYVFRAAA